MILDCSFLCITNLFGMKEWVEFDPFATNMNYLVKTKCKNRYGEFRTNRRLLRKRRREKQG